MIDKIYEDALSKWGINNQLDMVIEECSELIQAISKFKRHGHLENVYEEMADVEIMIEQFRTLWSAQICMYKREKLKRLRERIDE